MTPDQHALAEWVARWDGWRRGPDIDWWVIPGSSWRLRWFLEDYGLAWRAEDELIAQFGHEKAAADVAAIMREHCCSRIEATHRANRLRSGREG